MIFYIYFVITGDCILNDFKLHKDCSQIHIIIIIVLNYSTLMSSFINIIVIK